MRESENRKKVVSFKINSVLAPGESFQPRCKGTGGAYSLCCFSVALPEREKCPQLPRTASPPFGPFVLVAMPWAWEEPWVTAMDCSTCEAGWGALGESPSSSQRKKGSRWTEKAPRLPSFLPSRFLSCVFPILPSSCNPCLPSFHFPLPSTRYSMPSCSIGVSYKGGKGRVAPKNTPDLGRDKDISLVWDIS